MQWWCWNVCSRVRACKVHVALVLCITGCFFWFCFLTREEDKNIFDYCRENNIDYVTKAIRSRKVDVNVTDEEVWRRKLKDHQSCHSVSEFPG